MKRFFSILVMFTISSHAIAGTPTIYDINLHECFLKYREINAMSQLFNKVSWFTLEGSSSLRVQDSEWSTQYANLVETVRGKDTLLFISPDKVWGVDIDAYGSWWRGTSFRLNVTLDNKKYHIYVENSQSKNGSDWNFVNVDDVAIWSTSYFSEILKEPLKTAIAFELTQEESRQARKALAQALEKEMKDFLSHYKWSLNRFSKCTKEAQSKNNHKSKLAKQDLEMNGSFVQWNLDQKLYTEAYEYCSQTNMPDLVSASNVESAQFNAYLQNNN